MRRNAMYYVVSTLLVFFQIVGFRLAKYAHVNWSIGFVCVASLLSVLLGVAITKLFFVIVPKYYKKYVHITPKRIAPKNRKFCLLATWIFAVSVWSLYLLAYYPGILSYDFCTQITQYILREITTHHPVVHTLLVGSMWELGYLSFGNANLGFLLYAILQMFVLSLVYLSGAYLLLRNNSSRLTYLLYSAFVALFPLNGFMVCTVTKDVLFSAFVLLFVICCIDIYLQKKEKLSVMTMLLFAISIIGVCLFRNNGKYALVVAMLGMFWLFLRDKGNRVKHIKLLLFSVVIFSISLVFMKALETMYDAKSGDSREMLSVPMQQMARIAQNHHHEMDAELLQYIENSIGKDYTTKYNPTLADPIKDNFHTENVLGDKIKFIKNYFKMFVQYPADFINAVLILDAGYLYLWDESCAWINEDYGYIQTGVNEVFLESLGIVPDVKLPGLYQFLENWATNNHYLKNPLLRILLTPAWYFWAAVYYLAYALQRRHKEHLPIAFLLIAYFATLLLGPGVMVRYVFPMIITEFFVLFWYILKKTR